MAYKRISPIPIVEGGTNATTMATLDGVAVYDGTRIVVTGAGTNPQLLTSNGAGLAPTFQNSASGTMSIIGAAPQSGGAANAAPLLNSTATVSWMAPFANVNSSSLGQPQTAQQLTMPLAGTVGNLFIHVATNASTTNTTVTLNKNGVNTALQVTITALTTGNFSNTGTTVVFAQGDLIQFECSQATTGEVTGTIAATFHP